MHSRFGDVETIHFLHRTPEATREALERALTLPKVTVRAPRAVQDHQTRALHGVASGGALCCTNAPAPSHCVDGLCLVRVWKMGKGEEGRRGWELLGLCAHARALFACLCALCY